MAGGNPFMPPGGGANPGGPVPQPGLASGGGLAGQGAARLMGGNRVPGPGVRGTGASIMAPPPPDQPPSGQPMPPPPSQQGQPFAAVHQNLKQVQNQFKDGQRAQEVLDHLRVELDQLMEMGDTIRPDHVIEAAGRLVGHGIGATQLATIMSDMPAQGGEGLASWVRMHDVTITNAEQALARENTIIQHNMGVAAIKGMAASHLEHEAVNGPKPPIELSADQGQPPSQPDIASPGGDMGNMLMPPSGGDSEGGANA